MNRLLLLALLIGGMGFAADPKVADCFKVKALLKMDGDHYWADWKNSCPYMIDSVYVAVEFADQRGESVGNGLWGLHMVSPGSARVMRLSSPPTSGIFERISVRKITTDLEAALGISPEPARAPRQSSSRDRDSVGKTQALNTFLRSRLVENSSAR